MINSLVWFDWTASVLTNSLTLNINKDLHKVGAITNKDPLPKVGATINKDLLKEVTTLPNNNPCMFNNKRKTVDVVVDAVVAAVLDVVGPFLPLSAVA